ncbi:MAG: ABC transporter permease subunit [Anaerolineales bacterium]|nr:ABC transporter permease subunit [Anaerolineales bacterium]
MLSNKDMSLPKQILMQLLMLLITFIVMFPILWIVSMSLDPRDISRPTELTLIPPGASLDAYFAVMDKPTSNPVTFAQLTFNSLKLAAGVAFFSIGVAITAAYSFSRKQFPGRRVLMIGVITVLMLPAIATLAPLFVMLNQFQFEISEGVRFNLRNSLWGVGLALTSGALPFAIWNLKGYLDTIPKDLEEAAIIDGASPNQVFIRIILPLAMPAIAVTFFLGFMTGWTEFALSWQFLTNPEDFTLAMALWNMTGQYAGSVPWSRFAAMSLLVAAPVSIVYLSLQRYIVGGLTIGSVK